MSYGFILILISSNEEAELNIIASKLGNVFSKKIPETQLEHQDPMYR